MKYKIYTLMAIRIQAETIELLDKENEVIASEYTALSVVGSLPSVV